MKSIIWTHFNVSLVLLATLVLATIIPFAVSYAMETEETEEVCELDRTQGRFKDRIEKKLERFPDRSIEQILPSASQQKIWLEIIECLEGDHDVHDGGMMHDLYNAPEPVPKLEMVVHKGPKGYGVQIITENYTFTPENADTDHVDNEGHAHIYLNGEKLNRMYGKWYFLNKNLFNPGENTIRVELATNNHMIYAHESEMIDVSEVVVLD